MTLKVMKLHPDAKIPTKAHSSDAGFDLSIIEEVILEPGETKRVKTGIAIELPIGYWAFIKERGHIALIDKVITVAGVVDEGYRGEIILGLHNIGHLWVHYHAGDRVAQLIPVESFQGQLEVVQELADSSRGHGALGSSGRN